MIKYNFRGGGFLTKFILQLIGFIVVLVILVTAVLVFLDSKGFLNGKLGRLVGAFRALGREALEEIRLFTTDSGFVESAAGLLDQGAQFLRGSLASRPTEKPGSNPYTPSPFPAATPAP